MDRRVLGLDVAGKVHGNLQHRDHYVFVLFLDLGQEPFLYAVYLADILQLLFSVLLSFFLFHYHLLDLFDLPILQCEHLRIPSQVPVELVIQCHYLIILLFRNHSFRIRQGLRVFTDCPLQFQCHFIYKYPFALLDLLVPLFRPVPVYNLLLFLHVILLFILILLHLLIYSCLCDYPCLHLLDLHKCLFKLPSCLTSLVLIHIVPSVLHLFQTMRVPQIDHELNLVQRMLIHLILNDLFHILLLQSPTASHLLLLPLRLGTWQQSLHLGQQPVDHVDVVLQVLVVLSRHTQFLPQSVLFPAHQLHFLRVMSQQSLKH